MGLNYYDADVKCPFYICSNDKSITCEGIKANTATKTVFRTDQGDFLRKEKTEYMSEFCIGNYKECLIYQMLSQKYE